MRAMPKTDKTARLREVALFRACSAGELKTIARLSEELDVPAGKEIVRQGAIGREFFLLLEGEAEVRRNDKKVATLEAGRFFGELALLVREPRDATVVTTAPSKLLVIGQREFSGLLSESPTIARKLLEGMASRLRALDQKSLARL